MKTCEGLWSGSTSSHSFTRPGLTVGIVLLLVPVKALVLLHGGGTVSLTPEPRLMFSLEPEKVEAEKLGLDAHTLATH